MIVQCLLGMPSQKKSKGGDNSKKTGEYNNKAEGKEERNAEGAKLKAGKEILKRLRTRKKNRKDSGR